MRMAAVIFNSVSLLRELYSFVCKFPTTTKYGIALPSQCHIMIGNEQIKDRPILIIGDIHGCYTEMKDLVSQAMKQVDSSDLFIVCVGDMLNKGPDNLEVLKYMKELSSQGKFAAVRGNHEESMLREHRSAKLNKDYVFPLRYQYLTAFSDDDFNFLQNLPYSLTIPSINSLVVHAGLVPGIPLKRQSYIDLCHMRNLVYHHRLWGTTAVGCSKCDTGVGWATEWKGPQHVYFGHDARRGLQDLPFATGLDTGCVYGKRLTGILINSNYKRCFVSVPSRQNTVTPDI